MSEKYPIEKLEDKVFQLQREMKETDYEQLKKLVGKRLSEALETENYSEISRLLDIPSVSNVKVYIEGQRFPSAEVLARFRARGYSLDWLFTGDGSKWAKPENYFAEGDVSRISELARRNGISFPEQVAKLIHAGLEFLDQLD